MEEREGQSALAEKANEGLEMNVQWLTMRLKDACKAQRALRSLRKKLRDLGPRSADESEEIKRERERLKSCMESYDDLSDSAAAAFFRVLLSLVEKEEALASRTGAERGHPYTKMLREMLGKEF